MLAQKISLNKCRKTEIIILILYDHYRYQQQMTKKIHKLMETKKHVPKPKMDDGRSQAEKIKLLKSNENERITRQNL